MDEIDRALLAYQVRGARVQQFRTVKAAKEAAGVNTATWNRVEDQERVRDDSLAAIVETLWPGTGGDYRQVIRALSPGQKAEILHEQAESLSQQIYELESEIFGIEDSGSNPKDVPQLRAVVEMLRDLEARFIAARDRAAAEHNASLTLESQVAPPVGAPSKDADSLLYRRPDGVSDQEWERIRDQSRDYIEWLIDKAARER